MASKNERSKWEITLDVLKVTLEEKNAKKTRIQQRAYLDWRNFQRYFNDLLKEGFISKNSGNECYELTEKGKDLLRRLKEVDAVLGFKMGGPKIFISNQDWIRQTHESASRLVRAGFPPSPAAKADQEALEAFQMEVEQERQAPVKAEQHRAEAKRALTEAKKTAADEAKPAIPPAPPPSSIEVPIQEPSRPASSLTVSDVLVLRVGEPDVTTLILSPEEAFAVQACFQLQGAETSSLPAQESSFEIKVYAKEMISGRSRLLTTYTSNLVKDVLEYTAQIRVLGLSTGIYRLTTLVILPALSMAGYREGPIVQVAGIQPSIYPAPR